MMAQGLLHYSPHACKSSNLELMSHNNELTVPEVIKIKILFIYLQRGTQQGEWEREKQASHGVESPMWGSIPGL